MRIKFLATGDSPDFYEFSNELLTIHKDGVRESVDFSQLDTEDKYEGIEFDYIPLPYSQVVREAFRDGKGILHLTLCQRDGDGVWRESDWMDSKDYIKGNIYVKEVQDGDTEEESLFGFNQGS